MSDQDPVARHMATVIERVTLPATVANESKWYDLLNEANDQWFSLSPRQQREVSEALAAYQGLRQSLKEIHDG